MKYKVFIAVVLIIAVVSTVIVGCKKDPAGETTETLSWTLQSIANSMADENSPNYGSVYTESPDIQLYEDQQNDQPEVLPADIEDRKMSDYYKAIKSALGSGYTPTKALGIKTLCNTFGLDSTKIESYLFEVSEEDDNIDMLIIVKCDSNESADAVRIKFSEYRNKTLINYGMKNNDKIAKINTAKVCRAGKYCFLYLLGADAPKSYSGNEVFTFQNQEAAKVYNVIKNIYGKDPV